MNLGKYAQVHIGITNNRNHITVGSTTIYSLNKPVGYYLVSLSTGRQLHSYIWKESTINDQLVNMVKTLSTKGKTIND